MTTVLAWIGGIVVGIAVLVGLVYASHPALYFAVWRKKSDITIPSAYPHLAGAASKVQSALFVDLGLRRKDFHTDIGRW